MNIKPIAYFRSPLTSKFGIPRQSGVVEDLIGEIVFEPEYSSPDAIRGLEGFDYIWLIWGFSANKHEQRGLTVRPPRLGGNERLGVFATRSPFRPNPIGLSCVKLMATASPPALPRREGGGRGQTSRPRRRPYGRHTDIRYQALHSLCRCPSRCPWRVHRQQ